MTLLDFIRENKKNYSPKIRTQERAFSLWNAKENSILMSIACKIDQHTAETEMIEHAKLEASDPDGEGLSFEIYRAISKFVF